MSSKTPAFVDQFRRRRRRCCRCCRTSHRISH